MVKKLQGWKEKLFPQGRNEVFLKVVVQAILTYVMSCFIILNSIIKDIEVVCTRFWWDTTFGHERVRWINRKDLCKAKSLARMGFRDSSMINKVMLGK